MTEQKIIENKKLLLEEYYKQWRNLNWNEKESKSEILTKIDSIAETITDSVFVANFQIRIAYSFPKNDYFEIAEEYFLKIMNKKESFANNPEILETTFEGLGDLYFENKRYDKACEIYLQLLDVVEMSDFIEEDLLQMGIAFTNHTKAVYIYEAEELLTEAYELSDEGMDHFMTTKTSYWLGVVKYKLMKYKAAKILLENALIRYKRYDWDCKEILRMLDNIDNAQGNKPVSAIG